MSVLASFIETLPGVVVLGSVLLKKILSLWPSGWLFPNQWLNSEYRAGQSVSLMWHDFPSKSSVIL